VLGVVDEDPEARGGLPVGIVALEADLIGHGLGPDEGRVDRIVVVARAVGGNVSREEPTAVDHTLG
jgi:hypothetical protein